MIECQGLNGMGGWQAVDESNGRPLLSQTRGDY